MSQGKTVQIAVSKLLFDPDNPRHDPINDEPLIIEYLCKSEKVLNLAKSIAVDGLSPLDLLAVIRHPDAKDRYIVLEGNRRLCALKLLNDPDKAPTANDRRAVSTAVAQASSLPKQTAAVLFESREAARKWIGVRHSGQQDGVGTREWSAPQKARFDQAGVAANNPNAMALELLDYAEAEGLLGAHPKKAYAITTLQRFLNNPIFRNKLGLYSAGPMRIEVPQAEFNRVVTRFLADSIKSPANPTPQVNSRVDSKAVRDYANVLTTECVAPTTRIEPAVPTKALAPSKSSPPARNSMDPDKRRRIVGASFKVSHSDKVLLRLFNELRHIDADEFSFAAGYLLRAFVERVTHLYVKKHKLPTPPNARLHELIGECVKHLKAAGAPRKVIQVLSQMSTDRHSSLSPDTLGSWVHGAVIPTRTELNRRWDTLEDALRALVAGS